MKEIKELTQKLLKEHPELTISKGCLGEPRIQGHRLSVVNVLGRIRDSLDVERINDEYSELTKEQYESCLNFAIEFLEEIFDNLNLFSEQDLNEISD